MFGCLGRLGCLVILLVVAAAAWFYRDHWYPQLIGDRFGVETAAGSWQPVTADAARDGREKVERLTGGQTAAVGLSAAEVAGYVLDEVRRGLPVDTSGVEAAVIGDTLFVRAEVPLRGLGGDVLGPLAGMVGDRETIVLGGTLDVVEAGLGQFRVARVQLRDFALPRSVVPRVLRELRRGAAQPPGVADDAIAVRLPDQIADVRVARGRVTLYREVQ